MGVTCYPVANKKKSYDICQAFAQGCGGHLSLLLREGPAFFYGVDASNVDIWNSVRQHQREFYYCDNAFFDGTRQQFFRVSRNALQHSGVGKSDGARFARLGIEIKPWRQAGEHIVVCPQSTHFMKTVVGYQGDWAEDVMPQIAARSSRAVVFRGWSPDKAALASTLEQDLAGAHVLVTWSSAAAITAVLNGVPAIVMGQCAAAPMCGRSLDELEQPPMPDGREEWAGVLADNQWTLDEFRSGVAWRHLQKEASEGRA